MAQLKTGIWHYTSPTACWSIITNGEMWLTHSQFTNDSAESSFFVRALQTRLSHVSWGKNVSDAAERVVIDRMREDLKHGSPPHFEVRGLIASLSNDQDSLSQWRAYTEAIGGFAIGFEKAELQAAVESAGGRLIDIAYGQQATISDAESILQDVKQSYLRGIATDRTWLSKKAEITKASFSYKHESFQEEKEVRLFLPHPRSDDERIRFRMRADGVPVPYVALPLSPHVTKVALVQGPGQRAEELRKAAALLSSQQRKEGEITICGGTRSRSPYRGA